jgi:hypothetical protein
MANIYRQPYDNEFNIQNNNGVSHACFRGKYFDSEILDQELLVHWEDPEGGNIIGEMPQRLDTK